MGLKKFNAKKEIKKLKRRNSKLKKIGIIGILIGTIFIISSYALYSYTGSSLAFDSKVSKRIKTEIEVINGEAEEKIKEGDYKEEQTFKIKPTKENYEYEKVTCDNEVTTSYDKTSNTLKISNQTKDTKCQVKLVEVKYIFNQRYVVIEKEPDFSKGEPPKSGTNTGSGLYKTEDDDGESYYFRGAVENNYVKFGKGKTWNNQEEHDLMWRIVRINGDGSLRLILNESIGRTLITNDKLKVGFTNNNNFNCIKEKPCEVIYNDGTFSNEKFGGINSAIKTFLEKWYSENLKEEDNDISPAMFCNDTSIYKQDVNNIYHGPAGRYERSINGGSITPILTCPNTTFNYGGIYKTKIGILTADEMILAGLARNEYHHCYIYQNVTWWSLSPFSSKLYNDYDARYFFANDGENHDINSASGSVGHIFAHVFPVINLSSNVELTGNGTEMNPFHIEENIS